MKKLVEMFGIVPGLASQLEQAGVRTVADLAVAELPQLSEKSGVPVETLEQWQARSRAELSRGRRWRRGFATILVAVAGLFVVLGGWLYADSRPKVSALPPSIPSSKHTITLQFDYDLTAIPACGPGVKTTCVEQFNVYDISGGMRASVKLASIPAPAGAKGPLHGIRITTRPLEFAQGKHLLAITAETSDGLESNPSGCSTWVTIP